MSIRPATILDRDNVCGVYLSAFPEGEREVVSTLALNLLIEETTPQILSYVVEITDAVVGHIAFSPVNMDSQENVQGYILAPLGVKPDYQRRDIGSKLIEHGIQELLLVGVNILFVYGDPTFYGRFGFDAVVADRYTPPYKLRYPYGWQAMNLNECDIEKSHIKIACVNSLCVPELW